MIDAYVLRRLVEECNSVGVMVLPNHDSYSCNPSDAYYVRQVYRDLLQEIHDTNLMGDIISQLGGSYEPIEEIEVGSDIYGVS